MPDVNPPKTAIITGSDAGYFSKLMGLIQSVHQHRPDAAIPVGVLDVGLSAEQAARLRGMGVSLATPGWDVHSPELDRLPGWARAMTARCHLPRYFPGFDIYIWIDADAWLQDWRAIELLIVGAAHFGFALVPEIHRCYRRMYRMGEFNYDNLHTVWEQSFGNHVANALATKPVFNSGVFAMRRENPAWQAWARWMDKGFARRFNKLTEQCALNAAIAFESLDLHPLPAWCNWVCGQALPAFDPRNQCLIEPCLPCERISIVHPTNHDEPMVKLATSDGRMVETALDFIGFKSPENAMRLQGLQ